ncbi:SbcC/MukB-like Walker B domain-containing protein, partial [Rhodococcus aerolatus]
QREAAARQARAEALAVGAGFGAVADAVAAELEADLAAELTTLLEQARDAEVAASAVLAEPAVAGLAEDAAADVATPRAACERARSQADDAHATHARAEHRSRQLGGLVETLQARCAELGPVLAEADRVAALADTVAGRGQNSRRMSLHSYVLAARLEEVAVAASVRLQRMSGGRYELVHNDAAGTHGRRGGLGLDVRDDYTGVVRPASTLSGGESFLASLSLALGLADVVAAESGGVLLDTLFIDEGFGTLDADTLDQVMTVLDELRAGGRVVGLVSHVDELRQRIPTRLHVQRTRTGSSLRVDAA